jgi:serine/threonine protein kinase
VKQNAKPAKEKVKEPVLKEQEQVEIRFQEESQEHTFEESFTQDELTLFANPNTTSGSGLSYKPPDEEVLTQGTLIDGKYEIVSLLGHGGMGSVYLARHKELKTQVAVKVLHRFLVNTPSALERFKKEARAAHTLSSKNLVSVLDYGVLSDGQPYLTMHFIDGMNLAEYLKKNGPLSIADTFAIARQVAAALEEAHSKNIVHRDIKPSNILIEGNTIKDGSIRVVDFGISKGMTGGENTQQVTHTGQVFGSPFYMSPEQCKGENVDFRTDLYSLGCVIFECLTGSLPFQGRNAVETLMMHCNETPPTIGVHGKPPRGFKEAKEVLKKLLEKDRSKRFEYAAALNQTLQGIEAETCEHKFFAKSSAKQLQACSTSPSSYFSSAPCSIYLPLLKTLLLCQIVKNVSKNYSNWATLKQCFPA